MNRPSLELPLLVRDRVADEIVPPTDSLMEDCRLCGSEVWVDLESFLSKPGASFVCWRCVLAQLEEHVV